MERKGPMDSSARYHHRTRRSSPANGLWQVVTLKIQYTTREYVCPFSPAPALQEPRSLKTSGVFHLDGRLEDCPGMASQKLPQRASAAALARWSRARLGTPSAGTCHGHHGSACTPALYLTGKLAPHFCHLAGRFWGSHSSK